MMSQVLDSMDLEREKGITIKARAVRLEYKARDGLVYGLNLIDTPGHVDFAYEVSHSLQACEGAILVVDATQGIEAQTLANVHLALKENLTLIPVLNKIDLPSADPETIMDELENVLAIPREEVILASAKDGTGVDEILEAIVARIPAPKGDPQKPLKGLIFDSHYDAYKGVVVYVRLAEGTIKQGDADPPDGQRRGRRTARARRLPAAARPGQAAGRRRGRLHRHGPQERPRRPGRRHGHDRRAPGGRAAARLPGGQEPGLRRDLPGQRRGLPAPPRRAREAPPQRRQLHLHAGELGRARLRVPLRLPRPAPHGDRPGAPRARVRPRPHRLGAVGRIPRQADPRPRRGRGRQPVAPPEPDRHRGPRGALGQAQPGDPEPVHRLADGAVDQPARRVHDDGVPRPDAGRPPFRDAAGRADHRLLRPDEEPQPGLRLDGLRGARLPAGQPGQGRHPGQRRAGRRAVADRPPRPGAIDRAVP